MRNLGAVLDHEEPLPHPASAISRNSAIVASASHRPSDRALDEDIAPAKFEGATGRSGPRVGEQRN